MPTAFSAAPTATASMSTPCASGRTARTHWSSAGSATSRIRVPGSAGYYRLREPGLQQLRLECALVVSSTLECSCESEGGGGVPGHLVCDGASLVRVREAARSRLPGGAAHRDRRAVACRRSGS